ncbi:MAG TPA: DinB family protein [Polyangiaceae bacterium]|nr:DinB family protein [Polyangiaceae bacterium]
MEQTTHRLAVGPGAPRRSSDEMLSLLRYKAWADAALLDGVLALPILRTAPEGGYVTAIIRHFHTVDCIFQAHLRGARHEYSSPNPPDPATLAELQPKVRAVDAWYVEYARQLDAADLGQPLHVTFTDGQQQVLTRSEILHYVSLHGAGHRGQVALLLRMCGAEPPPDRFTHYLRLQPAAVEPGHDEAQRPSAEASISASVLGERPSEVHR